jgi:diadenosine tetraphosphatase ApaH/serine/threonine PP2A family protein phosphatase
MLQPHVGDDIVRCLVVSDIHANLVALEAVLADAPEFDEVWCLGDLVGYGPDPNECVERLSDLPHICLAGNHDWAALGRLDLDTFNTDARIANTWAQSELKPAVREYLSQLPTHMQKNGFYMAHASPREPVWEYILEPNAAHANFSYFDTPTCLVGHTHIPVVFVLDEEGGRCATMLPPFPDPLKLGGHRMIINPGSVGQPRDADPRAAYAILDVDEMVFEFRRVAYSIFITQERMRARGLPRRLIERLEVGR